MAETSSCITILEHRDTDTENPWETVNDGVMGGLSSGGSFLDNGVLSFSGATNTNGGGFSSVRLKLSPGVIAETKIIKVYMKRDARSYSLTMRTNVRSYGRRVAFRGPILEATIGEWSYGILSFDSLKASIWGQPVSNAIFDPSKVVELGLIIYDGKDGPFNMQLKRIEACN